MSKIANRAGMRSGLPFGTQKRVELARTLATDPKILRLDEPAGGLNQCPIVDRGTGPNPGDQISLADDFARDRRLFGIALEALISFVAACGRRVYGCARIAPCYGVSRTPLRLFDFSCFSLGGSSRPSRIRLAFRRSAELKPSVNCA